ncbi:MAG: tyrosine-type recombinase/integrase [Cyanobacteria bacterium J06600_6]
MAKIPKPRFNLKKPQSKSETLIYLIFRYRGQKLRYSTQLTIRPDEWDFKAQRPIECERRPDLWAIRRQLDEYAGFAKTVYIEHDYGAISMEDFKVQLDERSGRAEPKEGRWAVSFLEFLDLEIAEMRTTGMKGDTVRMFKMHTDTLKVFARERGDFDYNDVTWSLRLKLIDWLAARKVKVAYGNKTISTLVQFVERARRKGHHNHIGHQGQGWKVKQLKAEGPKVTLSVGELTLLSEMRVGGFLGKVRDLLLIGAGTGQRFSDFSKLRPEQFYRTMSGVPLLSLISQKTAMPVKVPLNIFPWMIPTLERYEYTSPKLSMQKFNEGLKVLSEQAGLNQQVLVVEQYMGRKARLEKRYVPKYALISSHICRRSFATNMYRMGYSLAQIMPITGHATEAQLRIYIGVDAEENAERIAMGIRHRREQQFLNA